MTHAVCKLLCIVLLGASCGGDDIALDCGQVAQSCESGRYRVDGAGCILECLAARVGETPPICPAGPPMFCPFGIELDARGCQKGCIEPTRTIAGLCMPDGEPVRCVATPECMSPLLVCTPDMRCLPRDKVMCDPRAPMCAPGLVCRAPDTCRPPVERCPTGYIVDPLGCIKGCRPMPGMGECPPQPVPPCDRALYMVDDHGCITGCRAPPTTMPAPVCGNFAERCMGSDLPICQGCAFGYTLDERHCLGTMCLPDPGIHPCAPPPARCPKGFSADSLGCLSCLK